MKQLIFIEGWIGCWARAVVRKTDRSHVAGLSPSVETFVAFLLGMTFWPVALEFFPINTSPLDLNLLLSCARFAAKESLAANLAHESSHGGGVGGITGKEWKSSRREKVLFGRAGGTRLPNNTHSEKTAGE